jgi:hypothetical protein
VALLWTRGAPMASRTSGGKAPHRRAMRQHFKSALALRDISHVRNNKVAFGVQRTSMGGQD